MGRLLAALVVLASLPATFLGPAAPATTAATNAPAPAPPASCPSNGHGGVFRDRFERRFTDPRTKRTSRFHIWAAGLDPTKPIGLVVQLHGDGAEEFDEYAKPTGKLARMATLAGRRNMILVAVRTPDSRTATWWRHPGYTVPYLNSLLDSQVFGKFDVERNDVWLAGYSGGTEFQTLYYLKTLLPRICGGGALLAGGGSVYPSSYDGRATASTRANFRLHFYTGRSDTSAHADDGFCGFCAARIGASYWQRKGFPVTRHFPAGINHYQLDEPRELDALLTRYQKRTSVVSSLP